MIWTRAIVRQVVRWYLRMWNDMALTLDRAVYAVYDRVAKRFH